MASSAEKINDKTESETELGRITGEETMKVTQTKAPRFQTVCVEIRHPQPRFGGRERERFI